MTNSNKKAKDINQSIELLIDSIHEGELSFAKLKNNPEFHSMSQDELLQCINRFDSNELKGELNAHSCNLLFYHYLNAVNFASKDSFNVIKEYVVQNRKAFFKTHLPSLIKYYKSSVKNLDVADFVDEIGLYTESISSIDDVYKPNLSLRMLQPSILYLLDRLSNEVEQDLKYELLHLLCSELDSFLDKTLSPALPEDSNIFYDELSFFLNTFTNLDKKDGIEASIMKLCLPPQLAYLIGRAYLNGENLPLDKELAYRWFAYGAMTGDTKSALSLMLHFSLLESTDRVKLNKSYIKIRFVLLYNFLCAHYSRLHPEYFEYPLFYEGENGRDYDVSCIMNYIRFTCAGAKYLKNVSRTDLVELDQYSLFEAILSDYARVYKKDRDFISAVMLFAYSFYDSNNFDMYFKDIYRFVKPRGKTPDDLSELFFNVFKENSKKGGSYSLDCLRIFTKDLDISLDGELELLNKLSDAKNADASFVLASIAKRADLNSKDAVWKKAADEGLGFGYLNTAIDCFLDKRYEEAIKNAKIAVSYGIPVAYMVLYSSYRESNKALAFTYLRMASEYIIPDAYIELKNAKEAKEYSPLAYMKIIERIEELSKVSSLACIIMVEFYKNSTLLPENHVKIAEYLNRSLMLGDTAFFNEYSDFYTRSFKQDILLSPAIPTNLNTFESLKKIYMPNQPGSTKDDPYVDEIQKLCDALVLALRQATTDLERRCYENLLMSNVVDIISSKRKVDKASNVGTPEGVLNSYFVLMSSGISVKSLSDNRFDLLSFYNQAVQDILKVESDVILESLHYSRTIAMQTIRSYTLPCDYVAFKTYLNRASNGNDPISYLLSNIDFSDIMNFDSVSFTYEENAETKSKDEDVVILNVTQ